MSHKGHDTPITVGVISIMEVWFYETSTRHQSGPGMSFGDSEVITWDRDGGD